MRQKVEANKDFEAIANVGDGIKLLLLLKGISFHFQSQKYLSHSIHEALKRYYNCAQGRYATTQAYMEHFQNVIDVVTTSGGSIAGHSGVEDAIIADMPGEVLTRETLTDVQLKKVQEDTVARSTAIAFLLGCDRSRYGKLIEDLENDCLQGRNNYPTTVVAAYNLLTNWKQENRAGWRAPTTDGVAFANADDGKKTTKRNVTCHKCGVKGHYVTDCPELAAERTASGTSATQTGTTLLMTGIADGEFDDDRNTFTFVNHGVTCQIGTDGRVSKSWILLDNQSTVDVFYNPDLLMDIRTGSDSMSIHCNAGVTTTNLIGELSGYGTVWFHPDGIANILSLARIKDEQGYRVTYDSNNGNRFVIHKSDGSTRGLYYLDVTELANNGTDEDIVEDHDTDGEVAMVNTVADNRTKYTNRAYSRASLARKIQKIIGRPERILLYLDYTGLWLNCQMDSPEVVIVLFYPNHRYHAAPQ